MEIPRKVWNKYIYMLSQLNDAASNAMLAYITNQNIDLGNITEEERNNLIGYAMLLDEYYGVAASELVCQMYDEIALLQKVNVPSAEPAPPPDYGDVAKIVNGTIKTQNPKIVSEAVGRTVKQVAADTVAHNALRDGAQWAWIPNGDTCAFCITLASRGWQTASKQALKNGHVEHIHSNCDCTYGIRFSSNLTVQGYDPDKYLEMYKNAPGNTWEDKVNSMRREFYHENSEKINKQKRIAYAKRKERESSAAEEYDVN